MTSHRTLSYTQGLFLAVGVLFLLGGGMLTYELVSQAGAGPYVEGGALTAAQAEAIKVTLNLFELLMTWALAIVGATGFFLKLNVEKGLLLRPIDLFLSLAIIVAAVLSLFFGHLGIDRTAELLSLQQDPVRNLGLRQIGKLQYLSFFSAVLLFGFHIFRFFWARVLTADESGQP
jgi:hypothetical protein